MNDKQLSRQRSVYTDDCSTSGNEAVIAQAWQEQWIQAAHKPTLAAPLLHQSRLLYDRFVVAYRNLLALSRQRRRKLLRNLGTSLAGAALALALSNTPSVYAIPNPPSIGNASLNGGTACDLKDAIVAANTDAPAGTCSVGGNAGADTITLLSDVTLTTVNNNTAYGQNANGLPVITSAITIEGNGATIARASGSPNFRIFLIGATGNLTLNATTVSGGAAENFSSGGIFNFQGTLTLNNSTVSGNNYFGVVSLGTATLNNSTISGNGNGGFYNTGTATLTNCTISSNGGVGVQNGSSYSPAASSTLTNCTVSGNSASSSGGGISNFGILALNGNLISGNTAPSAREIYNAPSCLAVAAVSAPTCLANVSGIAVDAFNLIGHSGETNAQAFYGFTPGASDITATSDGTKPTVLANILNTTLTNNGGATKTHALAAGSPAINAAPSGLATDQRGTTRPQGAAFDIGALEVKVVNSSVSQTSVTASAYNPTLISCGASSLANQTVTPTIHNNTGTAFSGLFFKVKTLDYKVAQAGGVQPLLCNADTQGGGVGATFTVADTLAANSNLTPSPAFVIGLPARAAYRFFVDLYSTSATVTNANNGDASEYLGSFEYEFDENGQLIGGQNTQFLPLITR